MCITEDDDLLVEQAFDKHKAQNNITKQEGCSLCNVICGAYVPDAIIFAEEVKTILGHGKSGTWTCLIESGQFKRWTSRLFVQRNGSLN